MSRARLLAALVVALTAALVFAAGGWPAGLVALAGGGIAWALTRDAPPAPPPRVANEAMAASDPILDGIDEPVLVIDDGLVAVANAAAVALLGEHVLGQDARLAIRHPAAAAALAGDGAAAVELEGLGAIGQLWEMRVAPVAGGGRVVRLTDHSAGVAAERMRTDFVANASHELRTPLASILGYVETLQGDAGEAAPVRQRFLGIVFDEASRMQRLVRDLMSLSRVEADRFRAPADRVDLAALTRDVAGELTATERGRDVVLTLDGEAAPVIGDRPQLSQLIHNIVGNAMAYGRSATPIAVGVAHEGGDIRLSVSDQGEGIAAQHLPRLTERFYRADAGRSRAAGGTGLGLAIVKHIVERHRGRLSIDSVPGTGTTVTVRLPAAAPVTVPAPAAVTGAVTEPQ